ncbi:MAG: oligopeptide transporter, OPT family [Pseudomonadota bacterium]
MAAEETREGKEAEFKPFIPASESPAELTIRSVVIGAVLGLIFSAVTVYLGLRAGLTIAVNIPIAIVAIAMFGILRRMRIGKKAGPLEINMVQITGAAGESIAAGVIFTLPALIFLGFPLSMERIFLAALAGGTLGVTFLIPLRRYLIEKEHRVLPYPEGVACAEVIKSGEKGGTQAVKVFLGSAVGAVYKFLVGGLHLWPEKPTLTPAFYKGAVFTFEGTPEMLGVGYIIGPRIASIMVGGGLLSWVVLIPMIIFFVPEASGQEDLSLFELADKTWNTTIRYIGAGAVAAGGLINLCKALPTIVSSFRSSLKTLKKGKEAQAGMSRISRDLPMWIVLTGLILSTVVVFVIMQFFINPGNTGGNILATLLVIVFGFFFATVSARLVGEIGVSSNPTSGMTIATLMATCLVFLAVGWTGGYYTAVALSVGAVVCICASNAGNVAQSLKTGYLLGGTPWKMQWGFIIGAYTSIAVVGATVLYVNSIYTKVEKVDPSAIVMPEDIRLEGEIEREGETYKLYVSPSTETKYLADMETGEYVFRMQAGIGSSNLPAPQARLMGTVINGILTRKLPWVLILFGVFITIVVELCGVKGLPFAVGVYLPLHTSAAIFIGGMTRKLTDRLWGGGSALEEESSPGVLFGSGLIAGGAITGLVLALFKGVVLGRASDGKMITLLDKLDIGKSILGGLADSHIFSTIMFVALCAVLVKAAKKAKDATGK